MILTKVNYKYYQRTLVFGSIITIVNSLPFLYILLNACFFGDNLLDIGTPDFLVYAFYIFVQCMRELLTLLSYGAEANTMDLKIKEYLINLSAECQDAETMGKKKMVYRKEGKLYILQKLKNGTYQCINDDRIYSSLDGFDSKNDALLEK
jgi:hypothetical protein